MKTDGKLSWLAAGAMLFAAGEAAAQTEIQWWHAMTGANNNVIVKLADDFNASQKDYKVVPSYKGSYPDTLNAGIAAFRAGQAPHIMQVFEVGTATMMAAHRRGQAGARADEGGGRVVRSQELPAHHHRLLLDDQGRDALVPVQLVEHGDVVQQGRLQEGRARPREAAEDLARGVRGRQEAEGLRPSQLRLRQRLGHLGQSSSSSPPGTTCRSPPRPTAWTASTPSSSSTARCT